MTYNFAFNSPKWFKILCGEDAYPQRNYAQAKEYLTEQLQDERLSMSEQTQVMAFFEKYW